MYEGKTAIVIGATCEVGQLICEYLLKQNASVVAVAKDKTKLEKLDDKLKKSNLSLTLLQLDITKSALLPVFVNNLYERFSKIDYVFNLTSYSTESMPIIHMANDMIEKISNVNFTSQILLYKYLQPLVNLSNNIKIIHFTCSWTRELAYNAVYNSSKVALEHFLSEYKSELTNLDASLFVYDPGVFSAKTRRKIFPDESAENLVKPIAIIENMFKIIEEKEISLTTR